jgi:hypothetical protein
MSAQRPFSPDRQMRMRVLLGMAALALTISAILSVREGATVMGAVQFVGVGLFLMGLVLASRGDSKAPRRDPGA